ncbi:isoaspartyl peptidase/L-asparaginase [bacterium]|nr:isoaspartyl peptidase/L-asparaginase [bacterium]
MTRPTIIVHGGAGAIQPEIWQEFREGSHEAAQAGQRVLAAGGSALDAAIAATRYLEDNPTFNAGYGSGLNRDGQIQCDALVMTGDRRCGAVAGVYGVRHPVDLARVVLEQTPHVLIVGPGAEELARAKGIEMCDPAELIADHRRQAWEKAVAESRDFGVDPELLPQLDPYDRPPSDTVGACALDATGHLAVASSTGGILLKLPGRAGDTPVVGSGSYCGPAGATSCTGHGEAAMRVCLAKYAYDLLEHGASAQEAADRAVDYLVSAVRGRAGLIVLDRHGNRAWATSTRRIAIGLPEYLPDDCNGYCPVLPH